METQKIANLLNDFDNDSDNDSDNGSDNGSDNESSVKLHSKFATRKWYIINDRNNGQYGRGNENDSTIKFETKVIKPNLCDYSDAYILVTGDIKITNMAADTNVAFKNCATFTRCVTHINDEHVETAENLDIIMPMYNLIEYSDNYADSSGSLYQFKRDEFSKNDDGNPLNVALDNSASFKYKASLLEKADDDDDDDDDEKKYKNSSVFKIFIQFF